jgi:hypothetical protein
VLTKKLDAYLAGLNLPPSGINIDKEKFPDRAWLILAIATLSKGGDEIFKRDYVPPIDQVRKVVPAQVLVRNDDGLLDVPLALMDKKHKRSLRMATLDKESRLRAKLMMIQNRNQRQAQQEQDLIKEIEKVKLKQELKAKGLNASQVELEETKQQQFTILKQQAQEFVEQELLKRDAERAAHMEQEIERRLAEALQNKLQMSPSKSVNNVEMAQESPENDNSRLTDRTNVVRMGTRKHPIAFGKVNLAYQPNVIRNQSEMSYDNENSHGRH